MNNFEYVLSILEKNIIFEIILICNALNIKFFINENTLFVESAKKEYFLENFNEYLNEETYANEADEFSSGYSTKIGYHTIINILFLILFFFFTYYRNIYHWITIGGNDAYLLINGEFWRGFTALTLHANFVHISSNILFFYFLIKPLIYFLGEGKAWFLVLFSGFTGNVIADYIYQTNHISIGFSTSVFGAIGILSTLNFYYKKESSFLRKFLPFGAGIGLFAFTGIGKDVDIVAHFTGLLSGCIVTFFYFEKPNFFGNKSDNFFKFLLYGIIILSWGLALLFK